MSINQRDNEHESVSEAKMRKWVCEYEHDGSQWVLSFDADDDDDVEARVASIRESLVLLGQLGGVIHADSDEVYDYDYPD